MAAKGINITEYRGLKVRVGKKAVLHLTDDKDRKIHLRMNWKQFTKLLTDAHGEYLLRHFKKKK
jgi:hypothetical protein